MKARSRPTIAVMLGDPAGIGPELVAKLFAPAQDEFGANAVIVGDPWVWREGCRVAQTADRAEEVGSFRETGDGLNPALLPLHTIERDQVVPALATPAGGRSVLQAIEVCLAAAQRGEIDAVCFAPFNKLSMKLGGLPFADELHLFAQRLGVTGFFTEFNVLGKLWTSRITSHIPLREVAGHIDGPRIGDAARTLSEAIRRSGVARPRLAVAGLNPHAGEGGTCGREEIDIIAPAIANLQREGLDVQGPFPADTIFLRARSGAFDGVVTMYHDQGQIALKLMGFDRGVTVQGGLPIVITTPAHGTAFDIVGQNRADVGAMRQAYGLAVAMARQQPQRLS